MDTVVKCLGKGGYLNLNSLVVEADNVGVYCIRCGNEKFDLELSDKFLNSNSDCTQNGGKINGFSY